MSVKIKNGQPSSRGSFSSVPDLALAYQRDKKEIYLPDYRFTWLDVFIVLISMGTYIADIVTDILVMLVYWNANDKSWAALTLTFLILPAIVMQIFSTRWYVVDGHKASFSMVVIHIFCMGPIKRYISVLRYGFRARRTKRIEDYQLMYSELSDVSMLRLIECFLESAPQLVLQLYIMIRVEEGDHILTGISACFSLLSLSWTMVAYTKALRAATSKSHRVSWIGMALQTVWRVGMVMGRITAIVLFATIYQEWTLLFLGIHWVLMTGWVVFQDTDFCSTWWEEKLFNVVIGVIYVFSFFNMKEGKSRYRVTFYYLVTLIENSVMILLWWPRRTPGLWYNIPALFAVWGGFLVGVLCMVLYYVYFHPASKRRCHCCIPWRKCNYLCQTWWWNPHDTTAAVSPYKKGRDTSGSNDFASSETSEEELDCRDFTELRCSFDTVDSAAPAGTRRKCMKHLINPHHQHVICSRSQQPMSQTFQPTETSSVAVVGDARKGFKVKFLPQHPYSDSSSTPDVGHLPLLKPQDTSTPGKVPTHTLCLQDDALTPVHHFSGLKTHGENVKNNKPRSPNTLVKNWVQRNQEMYRKREGCFSDVNFDDSFFKNEIHSTETCLRKDDVEEERRIRRIPMKMKSFSKRDRLKPKTTENGKKCNRKSKESFRQAFGFHSIDLDKIVVAPRQNAKESSDKIENMELKKLINPVNTKNNINAIKTRRDEPPPKQLQDQGNNKISEKKVKSIDKVPGRNEFLDKENQANKLVKETPPTTTSRQLRETLLNEAIRKKLVFKEDILPRRPDDYGASIDGASRTEENSIVSHSRKQTNATPIRSRSTLGAIENHNIV